MPVTEVPTSPAAWQVNDLENDRSWVFQLDDRARGHLAETVKAAFDPERELFDYTRDEFDLGPARDVIVHAFKEAHHGRGLALLKGLPRDGVSEKEFELLNWAIGLHMGVARPQGRASQYMSAVRNVGTNYRSASGRGFSSNAKLDFHVDGCDIVTLGCYNQAKAGGQSMISSGLTAYRHLVAERPDLAEVAQGKFYFSRQNEEAPDEDAFYGQPLFDEAEGRVFCKWNRNRVNSAQNIEGVPQLTEAQRDAMDALDEILRRPDLMFTMFMEPGDLQVMNNHVLLHSRTDFEDYDEPERKRLLCRLWLAPPDSVRLPASWGSFFRSTKPGSVRGGIIGHNYDETRRAFDQRQAASLGMTADA
jgi:hypothetical protein